MIEVSICTLTNQWWSSNCSTVRLSDQWWTSVSCIHLYHKEIFYEMFTPVGAKLASSQKFRNEYSRYPRFLYSEFIPQNLMIWLFPLEPLKTEFIGLWSVLQKIRMTFSTQASQHWYFMINLLCTSADDFPSSLSACYPWWLESWSQH